MSTDKNVKILFLVCLIASMAQSIQGQRLIELTSGTNAHIRGLSGVDDRIVWASGTGGMVGRSTDGGENWNWMQIPGFEKVDFRDVEAFDEKTAVVMGIGSPGYILRTTDGGKNWSVVYKNEDPRIFLDALFFWNDRSGMVLGDPIDGRFFILRSFDAGRQWREIPFENRPIAVEGEACFAASGSNIAALSRDEAVFVSGGMRSRFFRRDSGFVLPITQGTESTGANSIAAYQKCGRGNATHLAVVGGDFSNDKKDSAVCAISSDGGKSWWHPNRPPHGYRSSVTWLNRHRLVSCGTSGVDISEDGGQTWRNISTKGFHVSIGTKRGKSYYLAGSYGRIARLEW